MTWHDVVLRRILLSARMIGHREYGGRLYCLNNVPPIFTEEKWQRVKEALEKRAIHHGPAQKWLLSSIALCGVCERPLTSAAPGKGKRTYQCKPRFAGDNACGKISVVAGPTEEVVTQKLIAFIADRDKMTALLQEHTRGLEAEAIPSRTLGGYSVRR